MSHCSHPMKSRLVILASFFYLGDLAAQQITTHSGGQVNTTAVSNRIATQLPAAPDLANAWFLVEKLPTQTVGGNAIRARVYSINNLDQVMGINYIGGTTPTIWSASGAHSSAASDYAQELNSAMKLNDFSRFVANKAGPYPQGGIFSFSELGGVVLEQTLPGITLHGINNYGWMLAVEPEQPRYSYYLNSFYGRHFILKGTNEVNIALPRDAENGAFLEGINIGGQVVGGATPQYGYVGGRGFFAEADGRFRWLTSNNTFDEAYGVNDSGQIVGTTSLPDYSSVPAFWENGRGGGIESLPTVRLADGFENAWANGINKWGQIVGRTRAGIALWLNKRQFDFTGRLINPDSLKLISLLDINDRGVMLGEQNYSQGGITYSDNFILRPIWLQIAVDANRDGVIKFRSSGFMGSEDISDATSADKPYRFWLNDDDDVDAGDPDDSENAPVSTADYTDDKIDGIRDLEDLSRLKIYLGGLQDTITQGTIKIGLKWKPTSESTGSPSLKVWRNYSLNGGTEYLAEVAVAQQHLALRAPGLVEGTTAYIIPAQFWQDVGLSASQPYGNLLFEGGTAGKGQLVITLHKSDGTEIGEGPSVWIDLQNIKSMYERVKATADGAENFPFPYNHVGSDQVPFPVLGWIPDPNGYAFEPAPDERSTCIVFVHGWNQSYERSTMYAETMFKRMWHRGYKGRFVRFRWPTFTGLPSYNDSEYRAWKCGVSLKQYLDTLPSAYTINLVAHSMGNIVAGSALEQGASVANYALLNAAVPAICYDTSGNVVQASWGYVTPNDDPDSATVALSYQGRLSNASGNLVNFFLPTDSALSAWELNNDSPSGGRFLLVGARPHVFPDGTLENAGYHYQRSAPAGQKLRVVRVAGERILNSSDEAMGFGVQSPSLTVGADGRTRGSIDAWVDMTAYGFDSVHGAEFLFTIHQTREFYGALLPKLGVAVQP